MAASVEYRAQGAAVAALQFDLEYDQNVLSITATIGSAAAAAGKGLTTAVLPNGNLRFLIFGLNQNVIPDGSVANLTIRVSTNASVGSYTLDFFNASGAAPSGETVPIEVHSGGVTVVATFSSTLADISNMLALGLIDNVGIANSLSQKIQNAEDAAARRQTKAAKNILGAFQNEVHAQFTAMVAQVLLQDADSLLSQLQ